MQLLTPPSSLERIGAPHILGFGRSAGIARGIGVGGGPGSGLGGSPGSGIGGASGSGSGGPAVAGGNATGYRPAPLSEAPPNSLSNAASIGWVRRVVDTVNRMQAGKLNATLSVTLAANADSTVVTDTRLSAGSGLLFMPLSVNAAAEQAAGTMYVSGQRSGQATITHANNAQSDRAFRIVIIG